MEPTIIAAVVKAAGDLLGKVIEIGSRQDSDASAKARKVVLKTYDTLKGNLSDGCVKVLKLLENGQYRTLQEIRSHMYPSLQVSSNEKFDKEFRYRLRYLWLNGVVHDVGGGQAYGITRLGQAFLEEARNKHDYVSVLFG